MSGKGKTHLADNTHRLCWQRMAQCSSWISPAVAQEEADARWPGKKSMRMRTIVSEAFRSKAICKNMSAHRIRDNGIRDRRANASIEDAKHTTPIQWKSRVYLLISATRRIGARRARHIRQQWHKEEKNTSPSNAQIQSKSLKWRIELHLCECAPTFSRCSGRHQGRSLLSAGILRLLFMLECSLIRLAVFHSSASGARRCVLCGQHMCCKMSHCILLLKFAQTHRDLERSLPHLFLALLHDLCMCL